ncbi:hypothetical protein [Paraclostridium tenue]|uniref:Uncharacterized protein n=1 Tax=Paraclostridium tenue TaxID=1737 RepID=A0ABP3XRA2_9FIRM
MGLLQKYNVNIAMIEGINVGLEQYGGVYRVQTVSIDWNTQSNKLDEISYNINNDLANQGNLKTECEMEDFLIGELGLTSADLINFV